MNFIECELTETNEFLIELSLSLFGISKTLIAKIDTGSDRTIIPISVFGFSLEERRKLYQEEFKSFRKMFITNNYSDMEIYKLDKENYAFMNTNFEYTNIDIFIKDMLLPKQNVLINYGIEKCILIGMDILKQLDIHINTTNGKTILLACPQIYINQDYINRLNHLTLNHL